MGFGVFVLKALDGDVGVYLRRSERTVTEHFLDASQICPGVEQMRRERVSKLVGRNIGGESGVRKPFFHPAFHVAR